MLGSSFFVLLKIKRPISWKAVSTFVPSTALVMKYL